MCVVYIMKTYISSFIHPSIYVSTYVPRVLLQWNVKVTDEEVAVVDVYHSNRDRDEDEEMLQI